ncbi:MAG: ABC transporter ATP-binding protein [Propionibacteriaceae bacterium]|nr:ABC transporter ATP-binding protein [Propionibacteriaceae bacterium]
MTVLEFRQVTRTFPGPVPVEALKECSFTVEQGQMVTIVGPSGSGKSTLLNLAGLLDRPSTGKILVNDLDTTELTEAARTALRGRSIGFVFQAFHLMPHRSVAENVAMAGLYQGLAVEERMSAAHETIELVGLNHRVTARTGLLSGGERQRVAIARAMAARPAILLCDEPTGNLDSVNSDAIIELLSSLNYAGTTVVIITHNPEIASIGRQRLRLHDGVVTDESD